MEKQNQLAVVQKMTPNFVQKSMESIESAMAYADVLLKSKLVPNHFYEKTPEGKPDYTKGKPEAIVLVLQHGMEVGLTVTQSLQQVVPVNGLISIKGDGAKSLILSSGMCDIWTEKTSGKIDDGSYAVEIYSKRKDGKEKTTTFSVSDAQRAGLYYTDHQLSEMEKTDYGKKKAYAYKFGPWYKYPTRMCSYRAIGFISRDLYPDVLSGMVTTEEALDLPTEEGTITIPTGKGKEMTMKEGQQALLQTQSETISQSVVSKIDKANNGKPKESIQEAEIVPDNPPAEEVKPKIWTAEELTEMKDGIYEKIKEILPPAKVTLLESLKGRKSNKLYRDAVLYFQNGQIDIWLMGEMSRREKAEDAEKETVPQTKEETPVDGSDIDKVFEQKQQGITTKQATESFESEKKEPAKEGEFVVPPFGPNNKRDYATALKMYAELMKLGVDKKAVDNWKVFLEEAPAEEILLLIGK